MAHLHKIRKGWEKEHLAKFILSKFSFIAEPSTIADDIGSDIFCTLFRVENKEYLIPQNSFAIQIKSNKEKIDITNKKRYLNKLEIPFFVGVISDDESKIIIYAGEYLSDYFSSSLPRIEKTYINLIDKRYEPLEMWKEGQGKVDLYFPKVIEIPIDYDYVNYPDKIRDLFKICSLMQENISSRTSKEYVFKKFNSNYLHFYAGSGSVETFRENFKRRLAEVFFNLTWLYKNSDLKSKNLIKKEFEIYKKYYLDLLTLEGSLPEYLIKIYSELNKLIN